MRYVRGTPLGTVELRASVERRDGPKKFVTGTLSDADGICVEAHGVFIIPRWARNTDSIDTPQERFTT